MDTSGSYTIKPAGRHILTIGRDLIQDNYAAVIELVKNAYDADAPDVTIDFRASADTYTIVVEDKGHGMTRDIVVNKWMVPSTDDKLDRRQSPRGRVMQGRKGIGRYAASILGDDLLLETVSANGEKTSLLLEWSAFEKAKYLEDVEILIETIQTADPCGTTLTITGHKQKLDEWTNVQFDKLRFELKKLLSPALESVSNQPNDQFKIYLSVDGFTDYQKIDEEIQPFPILDLFDYRISGRIDSSGQGTLTYRTQKIRTSIPEIIEFDRNRETGCGDLVFDIRVYDRDKDAISSLIARGLKDDSGNYVGKNDARRILSDFNGIGVYRHGFRIRPLGDADFDWLKLNEQRVQNPSLRIGSNQVIGFVQIQAEESSNLIEKSARDGLRDNAAYSNLKEITLSVIAKLEERRFSYRKKAGIGRKVLKVERELEKLFSLDELKTAVGDKLRKSGVPEKTIRDISDIIDKEAALKNKAGEAVRQAVAVYQGQATLGKIINVILHEGRRPLNYFRNQVPNLLFWSNEVNKSSDIDNLGKCVSISEGIAENADVFVKLFRRLDPLAAGKRGAKSTFELVTAIRNAFNVFTAEFEQHAIQYNIDAPSQLNFSGWKQDLYTIFTNLIDNSVYWIVATNAIERCINVKLNIDKGKLAYIDYRDSGPGIDNSHIQNEVIFEPQFTTKTAGTGIGLTIAGEAAVRNGLEIIALESDDGAWFRIQTASVNS